jgi:hypothetical protein
MSALVVHMVLIERFIYIDLLDDVILRLVMFLLDRRGFLFEIFL